MSISFGYWVIPAFFTLAAFYVAFREAPGQRGDYDFASPIIGLLFLAAALIVSLVAWLIWALL